MPSRTIYDVGANTGQDLEYYLLKADRVIAVEANPVLCEDIRTRFPGPLASGQLVVENAVLTAGNEAPQVDFFIHREDHQLSQFPNPYPNSGEFEHVRLPSVALGDILARHGPAWYFKSDVENYDAELLRGLFALGVRPPYVSAEYHSIDVFAALVACGGYDAFKLVQARDVPRKFSRHPIKSRMGDYVEITFQLHMTGPFGEDIPGPWERAESFFRQIALQDLSWADIHATNIQSASDDPPPTARSLIGKHIARRIRARVAGT